MNTKTIQLDIDKLKISPYKTLEEFRTARPQVYEYAFKNDLLKKLCGKHNWKVPYFKKVRNKSENSWRTAFHLQGQTAVEIEKSMVKLKKHLSKKTKCDMFTLTILFNKICNTINNSRQQNKKTC